MLSRVCRIHYSPCQYLQCMGNAGIGRLQSVVGDIPAVRERRGSFQARRFTKQDDYVKNRLWTSQRGEVTRIHTHTQISRTRTLLWIPRHTWSSNQRARPELFQVLRETGRETVVSFPRHMPPIQPLTKLRSQSPDEK